MNTQTKDSLKKLAIIILSENSLKGKNYMKKLTFYFRRVVKITAISNNDVGRQIRDPRTRQSTFHAQFLLRTKLGELNEKLPECQTCRNVWSYKPFSFKTFPVCRKVPVRDRTLSMQEGRPEDFTNFSIIFSQPRKSQT